LYPRQSPFRSLPEAGEKKKLVTRSHLKQLVSALLGVLWFFFFFSTWQMGIGVNRSASIPGILFYFILFCFFYLATGRRLDGPLPVPYVFFQLRGKYGEILMATGQPWLGTLHQPI
jgi:hypothetical protein